MASVNESELKDCLPQIYKVILAASCLSCPSDPIQFLKNTLNAVQGHERLHHVDWQKFVASLEKFSSASVMRHMTVDTGCMRTEDMLPFCLLEKGYSFYRENLTSSFFRKWKQFTAQSKRDNVELALKMDVTKKHFETNCQRVALVKWLNLVKLKKKTHLAAIKKLERLVIGERLKRIIAAWRHVAKESQTASEYFKKLEMGCKEISNEDHQDGERDRLSSLPISLSLEIFQHLALGDWLNCAEVCCAWKAIIQSGSLWSQINFSREKEWMTDDTAKQILQNYRPFVTRLNLRGCTFLKCPVFKCISECRNLQELNLSECMNVTDLMVQKIAEGCPSLLYLNLSCTLITNEALRDLSRNCFNLQYLSLAYCYRFTDKGLMYLTTGKGCRSLIHLNLSGCTQMTVNGFKHISAACPSLREIVINDMPTLSDSCVSALLARCSFLSTIILLDAPNLSDVALKAISKAAKLKTFCTEGNNQLSDASWKALCSASEGLCRLHAAQCPRMTDETLKSVAALKNLQHLDISLCTKISDVGIRYLTEGFLATTLTELNVSRCSCITDISVIRIGQKLRKLKHLNISYCKRLTDICLEWLSGSSVCSLDISGCNIQDQGLAAFEGIGLRKLILSECVCLTDSGMEKLCKNGRDLQHVDVSFCVALSDSAIRAISFYCKSLVTLRMSGCPKITDLATQYLTSGSQYLRELDVSGCVLLTDRTLQHLERICPPLCSIKMTCCSSISRAAALNLQPRVETWEHSNDDPLNWIRFNGGQTAESLTGCNTDETWEERNW